MGETKKLYRSRVYQLRPTPAQEERLLRWIGTTRFVYNLALEQRVQFTRPGRGFTAYGQALELSQLRAENPWIADLPRGSLDAALFDLEAAFQKWRKGSARYPRFRRRGDPVGIRFPHARDDALRRASTRRGALKIPKLGWVGITWDRRSPGEIRAITIKQRAGKWYAAVLTAAVAEAREHHGPAVGIDRGVTVFAALSTGELIAPANLGVAASKSLARAQRSLARKRRGSNNHRKQRVRVARLRSRVANARRDFIHKTSTAIAKSHGLIVLEDLKVLKMTASARGTVEAPGKNVRQKAGLNRAILDQGWGMFREMLAYKVEARGGQLITVDPRNTSRTCAACGLVDADSRQGIRFSCRACGHEAHADTNAAVNILRRGTAWTPAETAAAADETGTSPAMGDLAKPGGVG